VTRLSKGLLVAALHALIVAGIGAKFLYDRSHYPRVWAETAPYDPDMPIRGRYVNIALLVIADRPPAALKGPGSSDNFRARLEARGGRLVAIPDDEAGRHWIVAARCGDRDCWRLAEPLAYFIPEHADDPSRAPEGASLWAEVTVPPKGAPRPVRLGNAREGKVEPIEP